MTEMFPRLTCEMKVWDYLYSKTPPKKIHFDKRPWMPPQNETAKVLVIYSDLDAQLFFLLVSHTAKNTCSVTCMLALDIMTLLTWQVKIIIIYIMTCDNFFLSFFCNRLYSVRVRVSF